VNQKISTWQDFLVWLRGDSVRHVEDVTLGNGYAVASLGNTTHSEADLLDGKSIVESYYASLPKDDQLLFQSQHVVSTRLLDISLGVLRVTLFVSAGDSALYVQPLLDDQDDNSAIYRVPADVAARVFQPGSLLFLGGPYKSQTGLSFRRAILDALALYPESRVALIGSPVLYDVRSQHALVLPLHVGQQRDSVSFQRAVQTAIDIRSDIIAIDSGNITLDVFEELLRAAEMGALVIATYRTRNAVQGLVDLSTLFPDDRFQHLWGRFLSVFTGIISLDVVPGRLPGMVFQCPDTLFSAVGITQALLRLDVMRLRAFQEQRDYPESISRNIILRDYRNDRAITAETHDAHLVREPVLLPRV